MRSRRDAASNGLESLVGGRNRDVPCWHGGSACLLVGLRALPAICMSPARCRVGFAARCYCWPGTFVFPVLFSALARDFWYWHDCVKVPAPRWVLLASPWSGDRSEHLLCHSWDSGGTWCGKDFGGSHIPQSSWPSLTDTCRPGSACIGSRATRCLGIPAWLAESLGTPDCPENGGGFVWASGLGWCRLSRSRVRLNGANRGQSGHIHGRVA